MSMPLRLAKNLNELVGPVVTNKVLKNHRNLSSPTQKARWIKEVMDRLEKFVPDKALKREIMIRCACPFPADRAAELKSLYNKWQNIDRLLSEMYKDPYYGLPFRKNNIIYITRAPHQPAKFAKAKTKREKLKYYCRCPYVCELTGKISTSYCYCGCGWFRQLWEEILSKQVKVEIVSSVLQGDCCCTFAIHI